MEVFYGPRKQIHRKRLKDMDNMTYQQDERSMPENGGKVSAQTSLFSAAVFVCAGVLQTNFSQSVFNRTASCASVDSIEVYLSAA